jgi:hypothetical protein
VVTHKDVDDDDIAATIRAFDDLVGAPLATGSVGSERG